MRHAFAFVLLLPALLIGCASTEYVTTDQRLGLESVRSAAKISGTQLTTKTTAGVYRVTSVRLVDREGKSIQPTQSIRRADREVGGLGVGFDIGSGGYSDNVGVGVGVGRRVGGRVVPGELESRFAAVDPNLQPFTLMVSIEAEPVIEVPLKLGRYQPRPRPDDRDSWQETWKLPDGTERDFRATRDASGDVTFAPVED